jgi:glycosyltransferase involved in cell wall biosynthesis
LDVSGIEAMMKPQRKIKVLFSIDGLHHGGAEQVIASLCRNLDREMFEVSILWRSGCGLIGEQLRAEGFELIGVPELSKKVSPYTRFLLLRRFLKERQIDVVHTHDTGALIDAAQCRLLRSRTAVIHTFHFGNYPNLRRAYLILEAVFSRLVDKLVAVGYHQAEQIRQSLRLGDDKLDVIYNGVASAESEQTPAEGRGQESVGDQNRLTICSISTLTPQKGLPILVDAARILRDRGLFFQLVIAGDGPLMTELRQQTESLGLSQMIEFRGWVANAAREMLPTADVFCQSSLWEANSIVLLEAMAAGMPIVTTRVGESSHVIDDGKTGMVVDCASAESLADALQRLIEDQDLRRELGENARRRFEENYTVDKMIRSYEKAYVQLARSSLR